MMIDLNQHPAFERGRQCVAYSVVAEFEDRGHVHIIDVAWHNVTGEVIGKNEIYLFPHEVENLIQGMLLALTESAS